jgi:hypothetical protein
MAGNRPFLIFVTALLNPGDEVIYFQHLVGFLMRAWLKWWVQLRLLVPSGIEKNFEPDLESIESKITPKTKLMILEQPKQSLRCGISQKNFFNRLESSDFKTLLTFIHFDRRYL